MSATRILTNKYVDIPKGTVISVVGVVSFDRWCCKMYTHNNTAVFYARIDEITAVSKELLGGL